MQNATLAPSRVNSKPQSCVGCPYYDRPGPVHGNGGVAPAILFVNAHATPDSVKEGKAIGGGAARVLDNACRRLGINRESQYTTNMVRCQVKPGEYVHWQAIKQCSVLLQHEMQSLQGIKVIVTLGEVPFKYFTGKDLTSVMNRKNPKVWLRGCPWPINKRRVIVPLMHPQFYIQTGFTTSYQFDMDLEKALRYSRGQGRFYEQHANYSPSTNEINELVQHLRASGNGGIDIETPEDADEDELSAGGLPLPINVIGISPQVDYAVGIQPDQYELLRPLFTDPAQPVKWYVFNASFDFYHIGKLFGRLGGVKIFDAMLALNRWHSDLTKKDLGMLMSFFTDMPYTKNLAKVDDVKYQWADTTGVLEGGQTIEQVLRMQNLLNVVMNQDHPLINDLTGEWSDGINKMRELGVKTDLKEVFRFLKISQEMVAKYEAYWRSKFPTIDWSSPKQLGELFVNVLKLPVIMKTRVKKKDGERTVTKSPTCDADALKTYRDKHGSAIAGLILQIKMFKHLGDFAGIIRPDTNRIHTAYMIHRQLQFRIQAKEPNLQTLPEELGGFHTRKMVIPDDPENDCLIAIDASQIELRIYAWICKAKNLLAAMEADIYIYGFMYEDLYKKPFFKSGMPKTKYAKESYVTPQEILAAKSGPLGFIYDRGPDSLVQKHKMDPQLAHTVHSQFHARNPEIKAFHRKCDRDVEKLGFQTNLWGGRRYFPSWRIQKNEVYSFHGQSNGAELLRSHYLKPAFQHLTDFDGSRVLLTVHDSMVVNVRGGRHNSERLRAVAQFLYDQAEAPIQVMDGFRIPAEVKYGQNWSEMQLFNTEKQNGRTIVVGV